MISQRCLGGLLIAAWFAWAGAAHGQAPILDARSLETGVELAWMADPITFPYVLRAYVNNGMLEVHGVVPSASVRKHALAIARLHGSPQVLDQTDIAAESRKDFIPAPRVSVVAATKKSIERALPQLAATIHAQCDDNGRVTLTGSASTDAEKIALSGIMRRVPGCSRVENHVRIGAAAAPAGPLVAQIRLARHDASASSAIADRPIVNGRTTQMRNALVKLLPRASSIYVWQVGPNRFQIQFTARNEDDANAMAMLIFDRPDWKAFHIDIGAHVPR